MSTEVVVVLIDPQREGIGSALKKSFPTPPVALDDHRLLRQIDKKNEVTPCGDSRAR